MATASDAAKAKAAELGVDLDSVEGTGANGNITVSDVESAGGLSEGQEASQQLAAREPGDEVPTDDDGKVLKDPTDGGVQMEPGSADEPQGPEDALGPGPKRGDYSGRQDGAEHSEVVATDAGPEQRAQNPRVDDVGDVEGEKGGVTTSEADSS